MPDKNNNNYINTLSAIALAATAFIFIVIIGGSTFYLLSHSGSKPVAQTNVANSQLSSTPNYQKLNTILDNLTKHYPSIKETYVYSLKLNPGNLLDKPSSFIAGVGFYDERTNTPPSQAAFGVDSGGAIEVYADSSDAVQRAAYLQSLQYDPTQNPGALRLDGDYVIRASKNYTSTEQNEVINYIYNQLQ